MFKKSQRGFSALEMLMVIAFVSIAFLAALRLLSGTVISSGELEGSVVAQNLANQKMEELMSQSFTSLTSEARTAFGDFPAYEYMVAVGVIDVHLKDVSVSIYWNVAGDEMTYTIDTILSDY